MGRAAKQGSRLRKTQQKLWRFLGIRRQKDHGLAIVWASAVCVMIAGLFVAAGYAATQYSNGKRSEVTNNQALKIADTQLMTLRVAGGLALGKQCFDERGMPRSSGDVDAPCSYYPNGMASGCLSYNAPRCYMVYITPVNGGGTAADKLVAVTYKVKITWGATGNLAVLYRLTETNPAYQVDLIHTPVMDQPANNTSVDLSQTVSGVKAITRLSDISGGPGVSISTPACMPDESCYGAGGKYNLTGVFTVATNIPSQLIVGCAWDFGDGSGSLEVQAGQQGCDNGQTLVHDYRNAWQLQNLPPFPEACFAPLGSGVDTHIFLAKITLHTTEGTDVASRVPVQLIMPGCA